MPESIRYSLEHAAASVEISLQGDQMLVRTQGRGALDKPKSLDISLRDLKNFCLVPTIRAQNIVGRTAGEGGSAFAADDSYDSEFIFSYLAQGKIKNKRVFVKGQDGDFQKILTVLKQRRPDASLLHLEPAQAQQQMGVLSASKALILILSLLVGLPLFVVLVWLVIHSLH